VRVVLLFLYEYFFNSFSAKAVPLKLCIIDKNRTVIH
jgi:hypothetical protein